VEVPRRLPAYLWRAAMSFRFQVPPECFTALWLVPLLQVDDRLYTPVTATHLQLLSGRSDEEKLVCEYEYE
jgi:hypothetical protein